MDPSGYDLALGAALLGARVVLATNGETSADFSLRDGALLERLGTWSAAQGNAPVSRVALADRLAGFLRETNVARSPERLRAAGARVIEGSVAFTSARSIRVGPEELQARRFVIATGRSAPGESTIADMLAGWVDAGAVPRQVSIRGGNADAIVLAGICRGVGAAATLHHKGGFLASEEPEAAELVAIALRRAGIAIHDGEPAGPAIEAPVLRPDVAGLALDAGRIETKDGALVVDAGLRTSNSGVFAIGSVVAAAACASAGPSQIGPLLGRMLFRKPADLRALPDVRAFPALLPFAAAGMSEREARVSGGAIRILRSPVAGLHGRPQGLLKAVIGPKGRILGVTIVADHAQELIAPWLLAIGQGLPVEALGATLLVPGSAFAASREAGLDSARAALASPRIKTMLRFLRMFG